MEKKKAHREDLFVGPRISKNKRKSTEKNERHRQFGDALFFCLQRADRAGDRQRKPVRKAPQKNKKFFSLVFRHIKYSKK